MQHGAHGGLLSDFTAHGPVREFDRGLVLTREGHGRGDHGDEEEAAKDPMNGVLMFADPRMKACCRDKPLHVNTPAVPPMTAGAMIIFPAHWTHLVTPYWGRRPRISIAWNMNKEQLAGEPKHDGMLE